ncbi:unnamed protein product (mitochondrion) [Plasmodiophora brassicae]|uniref:RNase III domain-containing protein n=1 Tax=Plasmodiophora brassicae TaxID=37360 RepID=A0A0G4IY99_PLABS|nr:hypothetical protein PBRA_007775 [Plasmodiophora brassicae]SPQ99079.1 unnamed protein product [Plasmodiophora brassicae]
MDLSASPAMAMVAPEQSDPIRLRSLGGDGTAEVEALIGDKLLDIMLYWRLLKRYDAKSEGRLTMLRGTMVSNETLALIGHPFVVPKYLSQHEWEGASIHEKGTAVEAIIGRCFLRDNSKTQPQEEIHLTPRLATITYEILDAIEEAVTSSAHTSTDKLYASFASGSAPAGEVIGHKNPSQALFEFLQSRVRMAYPARTITTWVVDGTQSGVLGASQFVAEFSVPDGVDCRDVPGLRPDLVMRSDAFPSKKQARDAVAKMVLKHLDVDMSLAFTRHSQEAPPAPSVAPTAMNVVSTTTMAPAPAQALMNEPLQKPPSALLHEWLQMTRRIAFPAKTVDVVNVTSSEDVTLSGAFRGIFTMPGSDPPVVIKGDPKPSKKAAKDDVSARVLAYYNVRIDKMQPAPVTSLRKRPRRSTEMHADDVRDADRSLKKAIATIVSNRQRVLSVSSSRIEVIEEGATNDPGTPPAPAPARANDSRPPAPAVPAVVDLYGDLDSDADGNGASRMAVDKQEEDGGVIVEEDGAIAEEDGAIAEDDDARAMADDTKAPMSSTESLGNCQSFLSRYVRGASLADSVSIEGLVTPQHAESMPEPDPVPGLLHFEPYTPWDSTPLRPWFETQWSKKPINALCMLKSRIDAEFRLKFWRCRLNATKGAFRSGPDLLMLVAFWDRGFGPMYSMGVGINSGYACKAALVRLWPHVKPHLDMLIEKAEIKIEEEAAKAARAASAGGASR